MEETSIVELLVSARALAFTGTLVLRSPDGADTVLGFDGGCLTGEHGVSAAATRAALAGLLPEQQLGLAAQHAAQSGEMLLRSVERLSLLPPQTVTTLRRELLIGSLQALCRLPGETHYTLREEALVADQERPLRVDLLPAIVSCAHEELEDRKAKRLVASFGEHTLRLRPGTTRFLLDTLTGPPRAVVAGLARRARCARALVVDGAARVDWAVSTLYALWLLQYLEVEADAAQNVGEAVLADPINATGTSGTRRLSLPSSGRQERTSEVHFNASAGETQDPSAESQAPRAATPPAATPASTVSERPGTPSVSPAEIASRERAMEKRVVEAWAAAESNSDVTERAARFAHKAAALYPRNARIQFFTARLDARAGRPREAMRRLQVALRIDPDYDDARRELTQMRQTGSSPTHTGFQLKNLFSRRDRE